MYNGFTIQHTNKGSYGKNIDAQVNLPEVTVTGTYPLKLFTFNPLSKHYPIGHSAIGTVSYEQGFPYMHTESKKTKDSDYNILTNNCSDATR
jgi:hypothetical protein